MRKIFPIIAGILLLPLIWVGRFLHRRLTGQKGILVLELEDLGDILERQLFMDRLRRVALDSNVAAVIIRFEEIPGGWATCEELRSAIRGLQSTGKEVVAWVPDGGNATAWLASACDRVIMPPLASLSLLGVGVEMTFFGSALERLGVAPDLEAAGAYKSFGEPFTRTYPSAANREATFGLLGTIHTQLCEGIASGRNLSVAEVDSFCARGPWTAPDAKECGLIDDVAYFDQLEDALEEQFGKKAKVSSFNSWAWRDGMLEWLEGIGDSGARIAVLYLEGSIVDKPSSRGSSITPSDAISALEQLREDDKVAAVVLHVNSPGGSAPASDLIWREVKRLNDTKPLIALFENVAASGGFYLSAPARAIMARPGTITGSIGVFGGKLVVDGLQRKLGITVEEVTESPNASFFSPNRRFTPTQRLQFRRVLNLIYDGFVQRVAEGRGRPAEEVEPHCRGRIWAGSSALELGLVDRLGGVADAVEYARELAELAPGDYRRIDVPGWSKAPWLQRVFRKQLSPLGAGAWSVFTEPLRTGGHTVEVLQQHPCEPLAMMPYSILIK